MCLVQFYRDLSYKSIQLKLNIQITRDPITVGCHPLYSSSLFQLFVGSPTIYTSKILEWFKWLGQANHIFEQTRWRKHLNKNQFSPVKATKYSCWLRIGSHQAAINPCEEDANRDKLDNLHLQNKIKNLYH